jgi:hypothetical protein
VPYRTTLLAGSIDVGVVGIRVVGVAWLLVAVAFAALAVGLALRGGESMTANQSFTSEEARKIGNALGIDWATIDLEQFRRGLEVELEHGAHDPQTNVTDDDPLMTGKIAWAHLKEIRDYHTRLDKLEAEAES